MQRQPSGFNHPAALTIQNCEPTKSVKHPDTIRRRNGSSLCTVEKKCTVRHKLISYRLSEAGNCLYFFFDWGSTNASKKTTIVKLFRQFEPFAVQNCSELVITHCNLPVPSLVYPAPPTCVRATQSLAAQRSVNINFAHQND